MDNEISIYESSDIRRCEKCDITHECQRCIKNTHICIKCGTLFYDCDICGTTQGSLSELKRHQRESKICKKARFLTAISMEDELKKLGKKIIERRYSHSN